MTAPLPIIFVWDGAVLMPLDRFSRLAEQTFTSGHAYKMIVQEEEDRRTLEQNNKMWALLTEFEKLEFHGEFFDRYRWKAILLHAWGQEIEFLPALYGTAYIPYGNQSKKMSKQEMSSFIEFILAEGTQRGVKFADDPADHAR